VKVPLVDQVPVEALIEVPTVQDPVTAGATVFVRFNAGTTAVAAEFAKTAVNEVFVWNT
jgi:hypothetical protein